MPDTWRTDDMALAAFLILEGHALLDMEWEMDSCFFVFNESDDLIDAVTEFVGDEALVNPRKFNMQFAQLKRGMFAKRPRQRRAATA